MTESRSRIGYLGYILALVGALVLPFAPALYTKCCIDTTSFVDSIIGFGKPLDVVLDVHITFLSRGFNFPDLVEAAQIQADIETKRRFPPNWKIRLIDDLQFDFEEGQRPHRLSNRNNNVYFDILNNGQDPQSEAEYNVPDEYVGKYVLYLYNSLETNTLIVLPDGLGAVLYYNMDAVYQNDLPFFIVQAVIEYLLSSELEMLTKETHDLNTDVVVVSPNATFALPETWKDYGVRVSQFESLQEANQVLEADDSSTLIQAYYMVDENSTIPVPEPYVRLSKNMEDTLSNSIALNLGLTSNPSGNLELRLLSMTRKLCLEGIETNSGVRRSLENCLNHKQDEVSCWIECKNRLGKR